MAGQPDLIERIEADDRAPIGALFTQLIDDGSRFAKAELRLAKAVAADRFGKSIMAIGMLVAALFLAQAVVTTFLVGLLVWLVVPLGPLGATLLVTVAGLAVCGLLVLIAVKRLKKVIAEPLP